MGQVFSPCCCVQTGFYFSVVGSSGFAVTASNYNFFKLQVVDSIPSPTTTYTVYIFL